MVMSEQHPRAEDQKAIIMEKEADIADLNRTLSTGGFVA